MVGFEHNSKSQTDDCCMFNMILNNGTRSDNSFMIYNGIVLKSYDYYLPQNKRITAVTILYGNTILGFRFHLSDGSTWCIGRINGSYKQTVDIADNEVIVGFKAKSLPNCPALYVKWQFITARQLRFD